MLNPNLNIIFFCTKAQKIDRWHSLNYRPKLSEPSSQKLFLLSETCQSSIFNNMQKTFIISTKNCSCHFNIEILKNTSPVILDFVQNNPGQNQYNLNIIDEENVLTKFEQLYEGKTVIFDEDELPTSQRITKILQIKNCPYYLKPGSLSDSNEIDSNGNTIHHVVNNTDIINCGVLIYKKYFINFLRKADHQTFKIHTKKNQYKCNTFGVCTSNILRAVIEKDPTNDEFKYDFDDENDEFQIICDLFNFEEIDIKSDNMDLLKRISEELEIECIIGQIDNYISNYEKVSLKIDEQQKIIDSIDDLYEMLYKIKEHGIAKVCAFINQSKWCKTEENVRELAAFILQVIKPSSSLHQEMIELLIQLSNDANNTNELHLLLPVIIQQLMTFYMPQKTTLQIFKVKSIQNEFNAKINSFYGTSINVKEIINLNSRYVYPFIRLLYKRGLISKDEIIKSLKKYQYSIHYLNVFFLPEILEANDNNFLLLSNDQMDEGISYLSKKYLISLYQKYFPNKIDLYEKMLDNFEPEDDLTKSIRHDDVDTLQSIITRNEIDISRSFIPYNVFDDIEENLTLLNYSAFCGSLKCFKYLLLNHCKIDNMTLYFAICGDNNEIIRIVDKSKNILNDINFKDKFRDPSNDGPTFWFTNIFDDNNRDYNNNIYNDNCIQYTRNLDGFAINFINCCNINNIIAPTIAMHKNDLFDWIFENKFISQGKVGNSLEQLAFLSAYTGNLHSLIQIIDNGLDLSTKSSQRIILVAARNGFYQISQFLLNLINEKSQKSLHDVINVENSFLYHQRVKYLNIQSIQFGNLAIFKLLAKHMDRFNLEKSVLYSIYFDYKKIVEYFFDNLESFDFSIINENFIINSFEFSFLRKNDEWFNFLFNKFIKINPELFTIELYNSLLTNACYRSNLSVVRTITKLILKENPKSNFTNQFIVAASSDAISICQYFIDSKVFIDYESLSLKATKFGSIDIELFKLIINNVNPRIKFRFYECINQAIKKVNIKLIDFLLQENPPNNDELIKAVLTENIEVVNIILKYNSKPSFVNQSSKDGTAISIAALKKCIDIVKRLLLVPGIDPCKYSLGQKNALIEAICESHNFDILESILNFYDTNEVEFKPVFIIKTLDVIKERLIGYQRSKKDDVVWDIIRLFLKMKSVDVFSFDSPKSSDVGTIFYEACKHNKIDIVESFLKLNNTDINACDMEAFNTPLMASIDKNNIEVAKLLINHPKIDINVTNIYQESAIIIACKNELTEIIEILLNDKRFDAIESKLYIALIYSNYEISQRISSLKLIDVNQSYNDTSQQRFADVPKITKALINSVRMNDIDKINMIINHPTFDIYKSNVNKCIFIAAKDNNIVVFRTLIKLIDNDINIINENDKDLLTFSSYHLSLDVVSEILNNNKCDPKSKYFSTCVYQLICNSPAIIKQSQFGNHYNYNNYNFRRNMGSPGYNPIMRVNCKILNPELIPNKRALIVILNTLINFDKEHEKVIKFDEVLPEGKSFFTLIENDFNTINEIVDFLIENGCDPNKPDKNGIYPLEHAIRIGSFNYVLSLVNSHRINYSQNKNGETYLHIAASNENAQILALLLEQNAIDINAEDNEGETPLMKACESRRIENIEILFRKENLDYLHFDKKGFDALGIVKSLPKDDQEKARKSKDSYYQKLMSFMKDHINNGNRNITRFGSWSGSNEEWNI